MPEIILSPGTTNVPSSPFTLSRGEKATVVVNGLAGGELCTVQVSIDGGTTWVDTGDVNDILDTAPVKPMEFPGMYRVKRGGEAGATAGSVTIYLSTFRNP